MSFVAGLLRGFNARTKEARDQARADQDAQDAKEERYLNAMASSDDEEVRNAAVVALGQRAAGVKPPKGGFMASLMGPKTQVHDAVGQLFKLTQTPTTKTLPGGDVDQVSFEPTGTTGAPAAPKLGPTGPPPIVGSAEAIGQLSKLNQGSAPAGAMPPPTAAPGSAAMPPVPTQGSMPGGAALPSPGAPPPTTAPGGLGEKTAPFPSPTLPMSTPVFKPSGVKLPGTTVSTPRKLFLSTTEKALQGTEAAEEGRIRGRRAGLIAAGFSEPEAAQIIKDDLIGGTHSSAPFQAVALEVPGPNGTWVQTQGTFNRATGQYEDASGTPLTNARPRQSTGSTSMGADKEAAAAHLFQKRYAQLTPAESGRADAYAQQQAAQRAAGVTTAQGQAASNVPLNTQQRFQATRDMRTEWTTLQKPVQEMTRQYQLMQTGLARFKDGDKIGGSQAILVTFQKILDPNSVVRESEYARSPEGLGLMNRLQGYFERLSEGGAGVPIEELASMVETARQFTEGAQEWNAAQKATIGSQATQYGIDPGLIFGTQAGTPPPAVTGGRTPGATTTPGAAPPSVQFDPDEYDVALGLFENPAAPGKVYGMINGQMVPVVPYINSRNQTSYKVVKK